MEPGACRENVLYGERDQATGKRVGIFVNNDGAGTDWEYAGMSEAGSHNIAIGDIGDDGDFLGMDWRGDTRQRDWIMGE
ncbi:MAG: hypothetical protein M3Y08_20605 [Fibrobacterota bacterium]|nr:hypothetical protein [Fibrobacterota bacterium]